MPGVGIALDRRVEQGRLFVAEVAEFLNIVLMAADLESRRPLLGRFEQAIHGPHRDVVQIGGGRPGSYLLASRISFKRLLCSSLNGLRTSGGPVPASILANCFRANLPTQRFQELLPSAVFFPGVEVDQGRGTRSQILREHGPLAAGFVDVKYGVEHQSHVDRA